MRPRPNWLNWLRPVLIFSALVCTSFGVYRGDGLRSATFASSTSALEVFAAEANRTSITHAESAVGHVNRANRHLNHAVAQGPSPSKREDCPECSNRTVHRELRFDQCNSRNDYLESTLQSLSGKSSLVGQLIRAVPRADSLVKPVCVEAGLEMRFGANSHSFVSCEGRREAPLRDELRPCISENYFSLVHNSMDLVSRCMLPMIAKNEKEKRDALREVYGLFAVESGLHLNAVSPTGAAGAGQFVSGAIRQVNRLALDDVRASLNAMGGACARLNREVLAGDPPMSGRRAVRCERTAIESGNPMLSMIYTYASIAESKTQIERSIFSERHFAKFFSRLGADERSRLGVSLAAWAHNTGMGGLNTPLHALLNSKYRGRHVTNVDQFLRELSRAMRTYPNSGNRTARRRHETSEYGPRIERTLQRIEIAGGGSCVR